MTGYLECLNERISYLVTSEEIDEYNANIYKDLNFGEALSYIKDYKVLRRKGWNSKGLVVFRQVPAHIEEEIIPKMQSLPDDAKKVILSTRKHIDYTSQMLIYNTETARADSWVPSVSDTLAEDWEVVDVDNL
jgi:uncharacterized protein (DUF1919 family)